MPRIVAPYFLDGPSDAARRMSREGDVMLDVALARTGEQIERLAPIHRAVADAVVQALDAGLRPTAVLGDCCQTIGVVAGLARKGLAPSLIWIDSHGDFNTWETTPSGFLGGMPLAMLTGRGDQRMLRALDLAPIVDDRVVLVGARDLDPGERVLVAQSGIREVLELETALAALPDGPLYLHFDTDVLDAHLAPAFLYPAPGGPSPAEASALLTGILATGRVIAASATVGWDVARDGQGVTERAVREAAGVLLD